MDIGAELKKARIARARYVPEIAHELKVPGPVIVAIEHNDFATVGNDARCSELVRAYAVAVGIDPEPLVTALAEAGGVVGVATSHAAQIAQSAAADRAAAKAAAAAATAAALAGKAAKKAQASEAQTTSGRFGTRRWAATAVVVVVLGAGAVWAIQANGDTPVSPPSPSASPTVTTPSVTPTASDTATAVPTSTASETATMVQTETPSPSATSSPTPTPKPSATYLVTQVNGLIVIKITCVKQASLHVYNASGTIFSGRLKAGEIKKFTSDTDATITTTNAGGLLMTVSGTEYGILGEPDQVYTHKFRIG